ncbi:hypothetical protein IJG14_00300 [bacterium]|nr:hypothetical protein [bacterium]
MKKDLIFLVKIFLCIFLLTNTGFADDFIMPDWGYYCFREKMNITENYEDIKYEKVRTEQNFDKFFDKQTIIIHKNHKIYSPSQAGMDYLTKSICNGEKAEKYILKNDSNDFIACYCSHNKKLCEIIRFYSGFDGLIEVRYTHNNLWHFQNNIGSFISCQMRIQHIPYEFYINKLTDKNIIRL